MVICFDLIMLLKNLITYPKAITFWLSCRVLKWINNLIQGQEIKLKYRAIARKKTNYFLLTVLFSEEECTLVSDNVALYRFVKILCRRDKHKHTVIIRYVHEI